VKIFCGSWLGFQWDALSGGNPNRKILAKWSKKIVRFEGGCLTEGFLIHHCESFCDSLVSLSKINSWFSHTFDIFKQNVIQVSASLHLRYLEKLSETHFMNCQVTANFITFLAIIHR